MTDIDPSTNLPQLPEDYFWNVQENSIQISKLIPAGEWSEWIRSQEFSIYKSLEHESRTREIEVGRFFKKVVKVDEFRSREMGRAEGIFAKQYGDWEHMDFYVGDICVDPDPVTPENILERTIEVYSEWQAKIAREKLYGNYPPKKLEASND